MSFDTYISEKTKDLGLVNEQFTDSNPVLDFLKTIGYVVKGGKSPEAPMIILKDAKRVDEIAKKTNPSLSAAMGVLTTSSKPIESDKPNEAYIAKNVYDIFKTMATTSSGGRTVLQTDIYNIYSTRPSVSKVGTTPTTGSGKQYRLDDLLKNPKVTYDILIKAVKRVIEPALKSGLLKWEEPRELSPKDLINKGVTKGVNAITQTAKEVWNGNSTVKL